MGYTIQKHRKDNNKGQQDLRYKFSIKAGVPNPWAVERCQFVAPLQPDREGCSVSGAAGSEMRSHCPRPHHRCSTLTAWPGRAILTEL